MDDFKNPDHNRDTIGYVVTTVGSLFSRSGKPIEARPLKCSCRMKLSQIQADVKKHHSHGNIVISVEEKSALEGTFRFQVGVCFRTTVN